MAPRHLRPLFFALLLIFGVSARASTIVRLDTPIGSMTFQLYDDAKPVTVANFLSYVTSGRYENTFAHRLPQGFVLQGGGYAYTEEGGTTNVLTFAPIVNEAGPFPQYSNVAGTIAMAKLADDPDSATSQWFINLGDNSANLDNQNGGFTVFGSIIDGLDVLQAFASFTNYAGADTTNTIVNIGSPFESIPFTKIVDNTYSPDDLIYTAWTVVPEPATGVLLALTAGGATLTLLRRRRSPFRGA